MRSLLFFAVLLFITVSGEAETVLVAPNREYSAVVGQNESRIHTLSIKRGEKTILSTATGYGDYAEVLWSPDSEYLAVVARGTKTTMNLEVYRINADKATPIELPDFRLNILGRFQKIEGGRYQFDESLDWKKGPALQLITRGSLVDGVSNPEDDSGNWYHFNVMIGFSSTKARLLVVSPKDPDEQGGVVKPTKGGD
ncbi:MAG: hypothetical protein EOP84_07965 [Verrucomicrobiaceae bacterium]|nr:MAG: hypothetical protein EOP84_07965 [Verrucomicrobiaceae bacterium]